MINIIGYTFEGPYKIEKEIIDRAAVYVILDDNEEKVDVGQSGELGTRLSTHERKLCWDRNGGEWFAVKWMPSDQYSKEDREQLEKRIRDYYDPPCGKK